jgi:hypothetical protein
VDSEATDQARVVHSTDARRTVNRALIAVVLLATIACGQGSDNATGSRGIDEPESTSAPLPRSADDPMSPDPVPGSFEGESGQGRSRGQTLYVPVYSHVYWGSNKRPFNLACTLSIRNSDTRLPISLTSVEYFDTTGKLVRSYLDQPRELAPLATRNFYVEERDTSGGSGANFIVRWSADTPTNVPIVEALMIGVDSSQGISFICSAQEISEPPHRLDGAMGQ